MDHTCKSILMKPSLVYSVHHAEIHFYIEIFTTLWNCTYQQIQEREKVPLRQNQVTWQRGTTQKALLIIIIIIRCYKEIWKASLGEVLTCEREPDTASDRYTIAVIGKSIPDVEIVMRRVRCC